MRSAALTFRCSEANAWCLRSIKTARNGYKITIKEKARLAPCLLEILPRFMLAFYSLNSAFATCSKYAKQ